MKVEALKQVHKYWKNIKNKHFTYILEMPLMFIGTYLFLLKITCIIERKQIINTKIQKGNKEDCVNRKKNS